MIWGIVNLILGISREVKTLCWVNCADSFGISREVKTLCQVFVLCACKRRLSLCVRIGLIVYLMFVGKLGQRAN